MHHVEMMNNITQLFNEITPKPLTMNNHFANVVGEQHQLNAGKRNGQIDELKEMRTS